MDHYQLALATFESLEARAYGQVQFWQPVLPRDSTSRQQAALAWIGRYTRENGRTPSFTEVRKGLGLPKATAHRYLKRSQRATS